MSRCDMQVLDRSLHTWDPYRQCKRRGIYLYDDPFGERWLFCRQHFDAYRKANAGLG